MIRQFALCMGGSWLAFAILGYLSLVLSSGDTSAGRLLLGILPVGPWLNLLYLLLGVVGLAGSGQYRTSIFYARLAAITGAALAVLGFVPGATQLPALLPLTQDVMGLHLLFAVIAAYFGWGEPSRSYIALL
ncbi:DUF4383 domain-containing protein [Deinococcus peraridilitoris]|nr:DUF4383 domain-containing protein [Deinococcus peraridilitoris]